MTSENNHHMGKKWIEVPLVLLLLFCAGALFLFFPNLSRAFASDDFEVIRRVAVDRQLLIPGFFRPLSDLTLLGNYLVGGFDPAGYYLFNILIHGVNAYMVFVFCRRWGWEVGPEGKPGMASGRRQDGDRGYALIAALFFLAYPFHSEGVDWILGRGASICTLFGLAALLVLLSGMSQPRKLWWAGIFYFIGMTAYEPAVLLPFYCLVILWVRGAGRKEMLQWALMLGGVLLLHVVVRVVMTGWIGGAYEGGFFSLVRRWPGNLVKVAGRLFLPPSEHERGMVILFVGVLAVLAVILVYFVRRAWKEKATGRQRYLAALFLMLAISCIFPVLTAVSTRTTETDRMLYFPSVFFCCILSFLIVSMSRRRWWRAALSTVVLIYMIVFLEKANRNWVMASDITRKIVRVATDEAGDTRLFIINLPDEKDGAFIFRAGFPEALAMMGREGEPPVVVNHLTREQGLGTPDSIGVGLKSEEMDIPPKVKIRRLVRDSVLIVLEGGKDGEMEWRAGGGDRIYYWNKRRLVRVLFP
jgi:hypothetical protein